MGRRLLLNLFLAVMVGGLGALAWLKSNEPVETDARAISDLARDSVTRIRITRPDFPDLEFNKPGDSWLLAGDIALPADTFQVDTILALIDAKTDRFYPSTGVNLTDMGLVPPQASLKINDRTFVIGDVEPIDKRRYVLAGDTVFLLDDRYQHFINAGPYNFIERQLIPTGSTITGLQLPDIELALAADNHWQLTPDKPGIAADDIRALIQRWQQVQALYVTDSNEQTPAGDRIRVSLDGDAKPVEYVITTREPDLVLTRPDYGIRYHITGSTAADLLELTPAPAK